MQCPCGSQKTYRDCCGIYHTGAQKPATPEALMRARYSAYTLAKIDFIVATMRGNAAQGFDVVDAERWAKQVNWLKLTVLGTSQQNNTKNTVTFLVQYALNGKEKFLFEKSLFEKMNDQWYYTEGLSPSIGRNDACPCGCGKKYKKHVGNT